MKIAVFPGSFDPITLGHVDIIKRSLKLFDKIIIGIGENKDKKYMFSSAKRTEFVYETFQNEKNIVVIPYEGLTVNFCKKNDAKSLSEAISKFFFMSKDNRNNLSLNSRKFIEEKFDESMVIQKYIDVIQKLNV